METKESLSPDNSEKCVVCGKDTGYLKSTPINQRQHYVVGVGQVCAECYKKLQEGTKFVESEDE